MSRNFDQSKIYELYLHPILNSSRLLKISVVYWKVCKLQSDMQKTKNKQKNKKTKNKNKNKKKLVFCYSISVCFNVKPCTQPSL